MTLLAIPMPVRAQSDESRASSHQACGERTEPRQGSGFRTPAIGLGFDARVTSTAAAHWTGRATQLPSEALRFDSSAAVLALCPGKTHCPEWFISSTRFPHPLARPPELAPDGDRPGEGSKPPSVVLVRNSQPVDLNQSIYYRNRLEFSVDGGWLPINIPFVFDVFLGDGYTMTNLKYTLVPIIASLRW
jgi:hypothetical protein